MRIPKKFSRFENKRNKFNNEYDIKKQKIKRKYSIQFIIITNRFKLSLFK